MSAAWGSTADMETLPRMKRMWRMWTYLSIGSIFYLYFFAGKVL
jgi:hypothetical protein